MELFASDFVEPLKNGVGLSRVVGRDQGFGVVEQASLPFGELLVGQSRRVAAIGSDLRGHPFGNGFDPRLNDLIGDASLIGVSLAGASLAQCFTVLANELKPVACGADYNKLIHLHKAA